MVAPDRAAGVELPDPCQYCPAITRATAAAVMQGMTMDVGQRPQSAAEFAQLLQAGLASSAAQPAQDLSAMVQSAIGTATGGGANQAAGYSIPSSLSSGEQEILRQLNELLQ